MEQVNDAMGMLDLMVRPGFCVKNNVIVKVNKSGQSRQIPEGAAVSDLLLNGKDEYAEFQDGCLYLTLKVSGEVCGASVTRMGDFDVFLLEEDQDQSELKAMALAAQELREPLANVMTTADRLFPMVALQDDPATRDQVARLNRGLFQMLRVIGNMSDASRYSTSVSRQEIRDITGFLDEIFAQSQDLVCHTGITLTFENLQEPVYCLMDAEKLERAILNIISNAIKFTTKGGSIEAKLTRRNNKLYLTVQDSGDGVSENLRGSVFNRYLRQPAIEDGRFGIGLGMVLIRSAAYQHGGTVLMDHPGGSGTRITMTLSIRQNSDTAVRSPVFQVDYAGGRDHGLIELSDCLPVEPYDTKKVN